MWGFGERGACFFVFFTNVCFNFLTCKKYGENLIVWLQILRGQIFKGWPVDGGAMELEMGSGWMSIAPKPTCGPGAILQNYITFNHKGLIIRLAYVKRLYGL